MTALLEYLDIDVPSILLYTILMNWVAQVLAMALLSKTYQEPTSTAVPCSAYGLLKHYPEFLWIHQFAHILPVCGSIPDGGRMYVDTPHRKQISQYTHR